MKQVRKISCLILALILVLSLSVTAFAAGEGEGGAGDPDPVTEVPKTGKITVNEVKEGQDYKIYQIFVLEGYDKTNNRYSYKANDPWKTWMQSNAEVKKYLEVDPNGYVKWVAASSTRVQGAELAKLLINHINDGGVSITPTKTIENATGTSITFEDLELGYYLIDTTTGALCSLETTDTEITVNDKNKLPTNDKSTEEGSLTDSKYSDASIGQTVNFKSKIVVHPGINNFIFHDSMSAGLQLDTNSISITVSEPSATATETVDDPPVENRWEIVTENLPESCNGKKCTFHVKFTDTFCERITKPNTEIEISYSATVTDAAVIAGIVSKEDGSPDYANMNGNENTSKVSYGEDGSFTTDSTTKTFTYEVPILKYTGSKDSPTPLAGAKYELHTADDKNSPKITFKLASTESDGTKVYKRDTAGTDEIISGTNGLVKLQGLDMGTYYLFETESPKGYDMLNTSIVINIDHGGKVSQNNDPVTQIGVLNNSGNRLPETGGIGTTIFYVVGSILLVGAGVLLVTKKRMSAQR